MDRSASERNRVVSRWKFVLPVTLAVAVGYSVWAPKGLSRVLPADGNGCTNTQSPKGRYRIEMCRPFFPYFSLSKDMPRFVRFYENAPDRLLGESGIVEMANRGKIFWPTTGNLVITVGVGDDAPEIRVDRPDGD
jgi:hypothetical protein